MATRAALLALVIAGLVGVGASASAQPACGEAGALGRTALPLDGTPVRVEGRELELRGTVDSLHDGSVLDAFTRRSDGRTFVADGPFVALPEGSELVHEDAAAHTYRVRLPSEGPHLVAFALGRVGASQLRTRSEVLADLRGAIELCAIRPLAAAPADATVLSERTSSAAPRSLGPWLGAAGLVLWLAIGGVVGMAAARRRARESWRVLDRRASRSVRAAEREVVRLGPAYAPVAAQAREVLELFERVRAHARELESAATRIEGEGREARAKRDALRSEGVAAIARGESLVERLEGTAAALAAELAEQHRVHDVDDRALRLGRELELAVASDREARAEA